MTTPYVDPQSIHNPATGTSPPAAWGDAVRDGIEFLVRPPGAIAGRTAVQSIANGASVNAAIGFNAPDLRDTDAYHDITTNNTRIVVPAGLGGWYRCDSFARFAANGTGHRDVLVRVNGSDIVAHSVGKVAPISGQDCFVSTTALVQLAAGDYVEMCVNQTSGAALNVVRAVFAVTQAAL